MRAFISQRFAEGTQASQAAAGFAPPTPLARSFHVRATGRPAGVTPCKSKFHGRLARRARLQVCQWFRNMPAAAAPHAKQLSFGPHATCRKHGLCNQHAFVYMRAHSARLMLSRNTTTCDAPSPRCTIAARSPRLPRPTPPAAPAHLPAFQPPVNGTPKKTTRSSWWAPATLAVKRRLRPRAWAARRCCLR